MSKPTNNEGSGIRELLETDLTHLLAAGGVLAKIRDGIDRVPHAVMMDNGSTKVVDLEHLLLRPAAVRADVVVHDVDSFIDYINRYRHPQNDRLVIFSKVTETEAGFHAVLDYVHDNSIMADRAQHNLRFQCQETPEWRRWMGSNKKPMSQAEFAQFIEDNAPDFVEPSSAAMREIALTLEARVDGSFAGAHRLENGSTRLRYNQEVTAKAGENGDVEIPSAFTVAIAPFKGFAPWKTEARLRYRIKGAEVAFWYELVRTHKIVELAAKELIEKIETGTAIKPLAGQLKSAGFGHNTGSL